MKPGNLKYLGSRLRDFVLLGFLSACAGNPPINSTLASAGAIAALLSEPPPPSLARVYIFNEAVAAGGPPASADEMIDGLAVATVAPGQVLVIDLSTDQHFLAWRRHGSDHDLSLMLTLQPTAGERIYLRDDVGGTAEYETPYRVGMAPRPFVISQTLTSMQLSVVPDGASIVKGYGVVLSDPAAANKLAVMAAAMKGQATPSK